MELEQVNYAFDTIISQTKSGDNQRAILHNLNCLKWNVVKELERLNNVITSMNPPTTQPAPKNEPLCNDSDSTGRAASSAPQTASMSPEAQRIAIAEACGWTELFRDDVGEHHDSEELVWVGTNPSTGECTQIPDYLNDLNAMHAAEKVLTVTQSGEYSRHITRGVARATQGPHAFIETWYWHASAAQRAEAFLRAVGKWTDPVTVGVVDQNRAAMQGTTP